MEVRINDNIFNVKTLVDKESQSIGMMGRTFDNTFDGLLFLIGGDKQSFWMKNCKFNISLAFMTENKIIVGIQNMFKDAPTRLHSSPIPIRYALEVSEGFFAQNGISVGDKISF